MLVPLFLLFSLCAAVTALLVYLGFIPSHNPWGTELCLLGSFCLACLAALVHFEPKRQLRCL